MNDTASLAPVQPKLGPSCISEASFRPPCHVMESAWLEHAPFLFWLIDALRPRRFVELGVHTGFSFLSACQAMDALGAPISCYGIDTWEGDDHAGYYGREVHARLVDQVDRHYRSFAVLIQSTFAQSLENFADGSVDLLHIDGRHRYDDVREDYTTWKKKLSPQGIVLFHDSNVRAGDFGVWRFWLDIQQPGRSFEFLHGNGLAILAPGEVPDALAPLFTADPAKVQMLRGAYARLGAAVFKQRHVDHLEDALARQGQALQTQHHAVAELRLLLDDRQARLSEQQSKLGGYETQLAEHKRLTEELYARISHLDAANNSQRSRLLEQVASLNQSASRENADLNELRSRLHAIESSTSWRAMRKAIRLLSTAPPGLRTGLRAAFVLAWRIMTPHREGVRRRNRELAQAAVGPAASRPSQPVASAAPPQPAFMGFAPLTSPQNTATAAENGRYALDRRPQPYVYVPPRAPDDLAQRIQSLSRQPRFSIITPVYDTPSGLLDRMIASVRSQWYPHWELILVDDRSPSDHVRTRLAQETSENVRVILLEENLGISGASNVALEAARGDYVVFLDHDDELTPDCLYQLSLCISRDDPDFVYSDEDKIDRSGRFVQPYFKPDWSPDTMMSLMYTCHVSCVRRALALSVGGLRSEFDGAQDWDFILRVVEQTQAVSHVPRVLYHWRIIPDSIAADMNAKPLAADAGRRARAAALERRGSPGELEPEPRAPGQYRVRYAVSGQPLVSIIIPSRDNGDVLRACVDSIIQNSTWKAYEIVVVDNGSRDPATLRQLDKIAEHPNVRRLIHDHPFNYSEINNYGADEAKGDVLVFLNDDTEIITGDWLERLVGYAQQPHVGAVGAKLLYPTGRIQHAGLVNFADGPGHAFLGASRDEPGYFLRALLEHNWAAVTGACLVIERKKFETINRFDETFPIAYNDVDFCFRLLKAGFYNVVCPGVELVHHESVSRGQDQEDARKRARLLADRRRLYEAHPEYFMADPFHNPNLHPNACDVPAEWA